MERANGPANGTLLHRSSVNTSKESKGNRRYGFRRLKVALKARARHATVTVVGVLFVYRFQIGVSTVLLVQDVTRNRNDFLLAIRSVFEESRTPPVTTHRATRNVHGRSRELAREVVKKLVRQERTVQQVARKLDNLTIGVTRFEHANEERVRTRNRNVVVESLQDEFFRVEDLWVGKTRQRMKQKEMFVSNREDYKHREKYRADKLTSWRV